MPLTFWYRGRGQVNIWQYGDKKIIVQSGSIGACHVHDAVINIRVGTKRVFNQRKKVYNPWNRKS